MLLLLRQPLSVDLLLSLLASCLISRCTVYLLLAGVPAGGGWKGLLSVIVRGSMLLLVLLLVLLLELLLILLLAVHLVFEEGGHLLWHYVATMLPHCGAHFISCRAVLTLSPLRGHRVEVVMLVLISLRVLFLVLMRLVMRVLEERFLTLLLLGHQCCGALGHRDSRLLLLPHRLTVGG